MRERVLFIEDDEEQARLTRLQLEQAGYEVRTTRLGGEGIRLAREWQPDLILLDVLMPDMNGWTIYHRLREFTQAPICFTTALEEDEHLVRGLDLGAEDYIIKPFTFRELTTRVRAALHRSRRAAEEPLLEMGPLRIDGSSHEVWLNDRPVHLTPTEFRLLQTLACQAGRVVPHQELLRQVWGEQSHGKRDSLKLYVWYLRRKLEADPARPRLIISERGVGYRLRAADTREFS